MLLLADGSVLDNNNKILYVSRDRFINKICLGLTCFMCGHEKPKSLITKEHVIPDWILRRFDLHNKSILLPNHTKIKYSKYSIPCCKECNEFLSRTFEAPISKIISGGFDEISKFVNTNDGQRLSAWLALIFIKTHIKDQQLSVSLNRSITTQTIAEFRDYEWDSFHHTYCLSRIYFSGSYADKGAFGSLIVVPLEDVNNQFDFIDLTSALTVGVVFGDVGLIKVFGDNGATISALKSDIISKINGKLTGLQFRELLAHFACCHLHLKNPPEFYTKIDFETSNTLSIETKTNEPPEFHKYNSKLFGKLMNYLIGESVHPDKKDALSRGELTFLFDENGWFYENPSL